MVVSGGNSLIIFDCDGVLVDSELIARRTELAALAALGHPISEAHFVRLALGRSRRDLNPLLEAEWGRALPEDYATGIRAATLAAFRETLHPVPGIAAVLDGLGATPRCVASSSVPERIQLTLQLTGLARYFGEAIYSAVEVPRGKPAPDLFLHAARLLGASPESCIVVEDSPHGITAAKAAGMVALGFTAGSHCAPGHAGQLHNAGADAVAPDGAVLAALIAAFRQVNPRGSS